ncbi:HVO_0758 family zinc finger protein [Halobacteriales archaeon Cl-PHB]
MESVRKGLRSGALEKDTYERLTCSTCEEELGTKNDPDAVGKVRVCPGCGSEWKEVG